MVLLAAVVVGTGSSGKGQVVVEERVASLAAGRRTPSAAWNIIQRQLLLHGPAAPLV